MKLVTTKFKSGGPHEKHVVATSFYKIPSSLAFQGMGFYWRNSDGEGTGPSEPSKFNLIREVGGLGLGDSVAAVALCEAYLHILDWMRLLNISVHWTLYWRLLLFMIPLLAAGKHILYSKAIWTTLQIINKNFQCWFSDNLFGHLPIQSKIAHLWNQPITFYHVWLNWPGAVLSEIFLVLQNCSDSWMWQLNLDASFLFYTQNFMLHCRVIAFLFLLIYSLQKLLCFSFG